MTRPEDTRPPERRGGETTTHHDQGGLPDAGEVAAGAARPRAEPKLPHEQDESASSQASASAQHQEIGQQAYLDTVGPGTDTDRGPVLDEVYNHSIAPRAGDVPPRR
ncbi:MAG: hypothetical protein ABW032_11450 [Burkholderiaceae bacterium]